MVLLTCNLNKPYTLGTINTCPALPIPQKEVCLKWGSYRKYKILWKNTLWLLISYFGLLTLAATQLSHWLISGNNEVLVSQAMSFQRDTSIFLPFVQPISIEHSLCQALAHLWAQQKWPSPLQSLQSELYIHCLCRLGTYTKASVRWLLEHFAEINTCQKSHLFNQWRKRVYWLVHLFLPLRWCN